MFVHLLHQIAFGVDIGDKGDADEARLALYSRQTPDFVSRDAISRSGRRCRVWPPRIGKLRVAFAQLGEVDRPSLVGDRAEAGNDTGYEIIPDYIVEVMQNRWRRFGVRANDNLQGDSYDERADDPVPAFLEGGDFV